MLVNYAASADNICKEFLTKWEMLKRICHMKNIEYKIIPLDSFVKQAYIEKDGKKIVSIP